MLSLEQIREIEERKKRLEKSQPSKKEQILRLEEQIREFEKSERELEQRKIKNSGNSGLLESINRELHNIREAYDDIEEEIRYINRQDPTIDDVFECFRDTIQRLLPILLVILDDYIQKIRLDSSDEIMVRPELMEQTAQHPQEWSKLVEMLFQFPRSQDDDDGDDYWGFTKRNPILEAQKERKKKEAKQYMDDILSQLHQIFFQDDKKRPEFLSNFGIFLTLAITNCDKSEYILHPNTASDFLSVSHCDIHDIFLEQRFQIIFFKALGHPIIKQYFEENLSKRKRGSWSFIDGFPLYVSKIESFLYQVEYDYINIKNFPEIVSCLREICDILEV